MSIYLSTVAKSGQVNTPPGSYLTVKEWAQNSFLNQHSNLLEIGCSNGFISIEMARYTGAKCLGIDLHPESIDQARLNIDQYIADRVSFQTGDASSLPFEKNTFSHVVISGHLPFIGTGDREDHVIESIRVLKPWGYLLVALYYYISPPPNELVEEFNDKIGTQLHVNGNKTYWSQLFEQNSLNLEYGCDYDVFPPDNIREERYIKQMKAETRPNWEEYLQMFKENGRYLNYFVRVYRKVPFEINPMIQIPRGGIYEVRKLNERKN